MSIAERQDEVVEEFSMFEDWMDKYEHLISLGKELPIIDEAKKQDNNLIKGCQSRVWLDAQLQDGKIVFTADSDAIITKGIIALMIRVFTDSSPQEIIASDLTFIDEIGLKEHLSPTRSNGLVSMIKQMKMYAIAFQTQV
ncbi:MAG: SufE family protein [Bacteroidetes bacterium]|nr:MAG: SufE family protein [Bacteroidota bacterium]MBL1143566.1 SufE family protein [Bacteroidota bacterium]MCB0803526.1 SufE family protein [Flavobacteriales bacterium]NOG56368.1 SufE family protein [Bacteroidota bacterium]